MSSSLPDAQMPEPADRSDAPHVARVSTTPDSAAGLGMNRTRALMLVPRATADNLRQGSERPFSEIAAQIYEAVNTPYFLRIVERRLEISVPGELKKVLFREDSNRAQVLADLRGAACNIVNSAVPHFEAQRQTGKLRPSEINLHIVFTALKISKPAMDAFAQKHITDEKRRAQLVGFIRVALKEAVQAALVRSEATVRETPQQRAVVLIGMAAPRFLVRSKEELRQPVDAVKSGGRSRAEIVDIVRLGRSASSQVPEKVLEFFQAIEQVPPFRATLVRRDYEQRARTRMQRALVQLLERHPDDDLCDAHFQTVETIAKLFGNTEVLFHPYRRNNDAAVVDALYQGFKRGALTLSFASCPNYSGSIETDPTTQKPQWRYDFAELGTKQGVVAERGLDFVAAWERALRPNLGDGLRLVHWEGTFEIAAGFKSSKAPEYNLNYAEAVTRLCASGEAVQRLYAERGISVASKLTREALDDPDFLIRKLELAESVRERIKTDSGWAQLADEIFNGRRGLYEAWFPVQQGESSTHYSSRMQERVVPENIAEYLLLGEVLRAAGNDGPTLVLAYDSPWMGEVYAQAGLPVVSGQGARSLGYLGA